MLILIFINRARSLQGRGTVVNGICYSLLHSASYTHKLSLVLVSAQVPSHPPPHISCPIFSFACMTLVMEKWRNNRSSEFQVWLDLGAYTMVLKSLILNFGFPSFIPALEIQWEESHSSLLVAEWFFNHINFNHLAKELWWSKVQALVSAWLGSSCHSTND